MPDLTPAEIARHYQNLFDSIGVIDRAIAESTAYTDTLQPLRRNVEHLEIMRAKDFWTTEDFTAVDAAIVAGHARVAEVEASGTERPRENPQSPETAGLIALTRLQFSLACVQFGVMTAAEAKGFVAGTLLPRVGEDALAMIPDIDERELAEVRFMGALSIRRSNEFMGLLMAAAGMDDEQADAFFEFGAAID